MGKVITIDGPAASGKTSVSRELATRLGSMWVSTGAFYRGLAYAALQQGQGVNDEEALTALAKSSHWSVTMSLEATSVFYQGQDVTSEISREDVGSLASQISHFPEVRKALLAAQRACADQTSILVAEGRDCGTVVFPAAEVKVYLTARSSHRAERRAKELGLDKTATQEAQKLRDQQDSQRKAAPLQIPEDAFVVDSSKLSFDEVVEKIEEHVRGRL